MHHDFYRSYGRVQTDENVLAQSLDPSNWDDVQNVKKYAKGSIFGEKYKTAVKKCFAFNCDLRRPRSHRQAFESIVGSLEDMISSLTLDDGEWV